jgi:calcineurin-like phosphoesterase family protein
MNRQLRFQQKHDGQVHFTSDFHLNHNPKWPVPIWKARRFDSVDEMNTAIIDSVNRNVGQDDHLFYGGDFCLNCTEEQFEQFISRIVCKNIWLLWGNHNSCTWSTYKRELAKQFPDFGEDDVELYPFRYKNIIFIGNYAEVVVDGRAIVFNHYPIHSWNEMKRGTIHLYGHQHCENNPQGGKRLDVGWDRDMRPYSANQIFAMMKDVPVLSDGGHH